MHMHVHASREMSMRPSQEVFLTSEYICIAMEYATGGSLFAYVQKQGRLNVSEKSRVCMVSVSCPNNCPSAGSCSALVLPTADPWHRLLPQEGGGQQRRQAGEHAAAGEWAAMGHMMAPEERSLF